MATFDYKGATDWNEQRKKKKDSAPSSTSKKSTNTNTKQNNTKKQTTQNNQKKSSGSGTFDYEGAKSWYANRTPENSWRKGPQKNEREISKAANLINEISDYASGKNADSYREHGTSLTNKSFRKRIETSRADLKRIQKDFGDKFGDEYKQSLQSMIDALDEADNNLGAYSAYNKNKSAYDEASFNARMEEKYKDADYDAIQDAINKIGRRAEGPSEKSKTVRRAKDAITEEDDLVGRISDFFMPGLNRKKVNSIAQNVIDTLEPTLTDKDRYGNEAYKELQWLKNKRQGLRTTDIVNQEIAEKENELYSKPYDPNNADTSEAANEKRAMFRQELAAAKDRINADRTMSDAEKTQAIAQAEDELQKRYGEYGTNARNLMPELENLKSERYILEGKDILNGLEQNADFAEKSKITADMPGWLKGVKESVGDNAYSGGDLAGYALQLGQDTYAGNLALFELTDDERAKLRYMWNTQGEQAVQDYVDKYLRYDINARFDTQANELFSEWAKDNPVGMSALSVATNLGSGMAYLDTAAQKLGNTINGEPDRPVDWNRPVSTGTYGFTTSTRDTVANDVLGGGVNGFLYQTVMSMADSGAIMAMTAGAGLMGAGAEQAFSAGGRLAVNTAFTSMLGGAAAESAARTAKDAGATDNQALTIGLLEGAAETIFEEVSLGNIQAIAGNTSGVTLRKFFENILKQGMVEGSEEVFTTLANTLSEAVVLGDKSTYNQNLQQYLAQGYSQEEADKMASRDWWNQLFQDFLGGAISGGLFGAGGSFVARTNYNRSGKNILAKESGDAFVDSVVENISDKNSEAYKYAEDLQANPDKITKGTLGTLQGLVDDYAQTSDAAKEEAAQARQTMSSANVMDRMVQGIRDERAAQTQALAQENNEATIEQTATRAANIESGKEQAVEVPKQKIATNKTAQANAEKMHDATVYRDGKSEKVATRIQVTDTDSSDSSITIKLDDGTEVKSDAITFADKNTQAIIVEANNLAGDGWTADQVQSFIDNYDGKTNPSAYAAAFKLAALRASTDIAGDKVSSSSLSMVTGILNGDQVRAAYTVGLQQNDMGTDAISQIRAEADKAFVAEAKRQTSKTIKNSAARAKTAQAKIDAAVNEKGATSINEGGFTYEGKVTKANRGTLNALKQIAKTLGINLVVMDKIETQIAKRDKNGNIVKDENGNTVYVEANGYYTRTEDAVYLSLDADRPLRVVLAHELTHFIQRYSPALYEKLKTYVRKYMNRNNQDFDRQVEAYMQKNPNLTRDGAIDEVVADACDMFLDASRFTQEIANEIAATDRTLAEKIREFIQKLLNDFAAFFTDQGRADQKSQSDISALLAKSVSVDDLNKIKAMWDTALSSAVVAHDAMAESDMEVANSSDNAEDYVQYSFKSLAEALGFTIDSDETVRRIFDSLGKEVTKVTEDHVRQSPAGALINYAVEKGSLTKEQAQKQYELFAKIMNISLKTNTPFSQMMQFMGSAIFTGMKMNADAQYGTTYDFVSICTKTQSVIDHMSARMVAVGRALTQKEIEGLYQKAFTEGQPVPCPECYVFTHWVGIGSLLDNINKYQTRYAAMTPEQVAIEYFKQKAEMDAYAKDNGITAGKAKGALAKKIAKEFNDITKDIEEKKKNGELPTAKELAKLDKYEKALTKVKAMTWFEKVYFGGDGRLPSSIENASKAKMNSRAVVPKEVLFNLNAGGTFATEYPEAWDFRTTQGAGYGKAITPYAEAVLGEGILVTAQKNKAIKGKMKGTLDNLFLQPEIDEDGNAVLPKKARTVLENARKAQKKQAFLGGQRFQSTSDARLENASDYLIAALEMQAMGGMVQVYTKVAGAVPAFNTWGFSINQSLMPLGAGLDENNNIVDTPTGGMNQLAEAENRAKYEGAGNITIGVNDAHVRALMNDAPTVIGNKIYENFIRDFIIPYHASGGKVELINFFRQVQDPTSTGITRSTDYTRTQEDKEIPDDLLKSMYMERGMSEAEANAKIADVKKFRQQRLAILTGNEKKYGKIDTDYIRAEGNEFLGNLYDKFHGGEWDGVKLAVSTIKTSVFPNEYWDTSVDYAHSGANTQRYLDVCERLGFLHRFSGKIIKSVKHEDGPTTHEFAAATGYDGNGNKVELTDLAYKPGSNTEIEPFFWKTLVDRRMYGHDGQYLAQKVVTLDDTTTDTVTSFAVEKMNPRQYNSELSSLSAEEAAVMSQEDLEALGKKWEKRFEKSDEQFSLKETDDAYMAAVNKGDMETAQRMVDEAARMNGYTVKAYHGTPNKGFTVFDKNKKIRGRAFGDGSYFASVRGAAEYYARNWKIYDEKKKTLVDLGTPGVYDVYLKIGENALEFDWSNFTYNGRKVGPAGRMPMIQMDIKANPDKDVVVHNIKDGSDVPTTVYVIKNPNQIKSADAVAYDKNGNIIPLSQRFNEAEEDVYYSMKESSIKAIEHFGTTDEWIYTGYITPDGSQLDFSGRHWGAEPIEPSIFMTARQVDHGEINEIYDGPIGTTEARNMFIADGNIRVIPEWNGIELSVMPTAAQFRSLADYIEFCNDWGEELTLDISKANGFNAYNEKFFNPTPSKVFKAIRDFFVARETSQKIAEETGIKLGETEEPQFQYSLKDTDSMSNREILAGAFDVIAQTDKEKEVLEQYRESVEKLDGIQAKLDEARKEIHTIMFTKGGRAQMGDRLAELQENVKKWEKQLTLWDGKLIRLQASKPIRDIVTRARANEARQTAAKYRERIAGVRESNAVKDVKRKLKKLYNDLRKRAVSPTEGKYIPAPLMKTMLEVLDLIDLRGERTDTKIYAKLTDMRHQYQKLKNDNDYLNKSAYDEQIDTMLEGLIDAVGDKAVRDMSRQQLADVYSILRSISYTLNQKVKQIGKATALSNYELGTRAIKEVRDAKGPLSKVSRAYNMGSLSPMRFFRMISGWARDSVLQDLARQLNEGQRKQNEILMKGYGLFQEFLATRADQREFDAFHGKNKNDWIQLKDANGDPMTDANGKEVYITHDMLVALYMHSLNEDNLRHVLGGGIIIPDLNAYVKGKGQNAYEGQQKIMLTEDMLQKLFKSELTTYDMKYAQVVYDFFNTFSKQVINETSMALNGYKKAEVDNYFPIHVDNNFLGAQFDSLINDGTLEGMGILKQRMHSSLPIYLEGASDAVIRNLNSVAKYGGLAIPIKNFERVYRVTSVLTDQTGEVIDRFDDSVQKSIRDKWGDIGMGYIESLMSDLQFGASSRKGWDSLVNKFFTRARGKFAQATLSMNLSVTLKQAASYPTAAAELGWAPLAKALMTTEKVDLNTLAKYTPIMWLRSHGFVDTELGDAINQQDWSSKVKGIMGWIQKMDIATVTKLAKATEFYIRQTQPSLQVGSDEYWRAVAAKFNDVVEKTQPNYSVMQRPEVLRSQNAILRSLTMFMTQRLQNYNILFDAVGEYNAAKNSGDTAWQKKAGLNLRRAVTSQAVAAAVIAAMTMAVSMLTHRMKRYRDDDDEITAESFMGAFFGDMISTVAGSFLGGSEVYEIINNFTNGTTYDVLDAPNITMVNDVIAAFEEFGKIAADIDKKRQEAEENGELYEGDADAEKLLWQLKEVGTTIAKFMGVPVDNAWKLGEGVYYYALDAANGTLWESDIDRSKTDYYNQMVKAIQEGDMDRYNKLHEKAMELVMQDSKYEGENAKTDAENTIQKGIKMVLAKNDERVRQAAEAMLASDTTTAGNLRKEMIAEGYSESAVVGAINYMIGQLKDDDETPVDDTVEDWEPKVYTSADIQRAYENNNQEALDDIKDYFMEQGLTEAEAQKKVDDEARKVVRPSLYAAIEDGNVNDAKKYIEDLRRFGQPDDWSIIKTLSQKYHPIWIDYYIHGETAKMKALEQTLHALGLKNKEGNTHYTQGTFDAWKKQYQKGK